MSAVPTSTLARVVTLLSDLDLTYVVGGSLSSSHYGVPRATNDVDVVVDIGTQHVTAFVAAAEAGFHVDAEAVAEAVRIGRSFNIVDRTTFDKVDVFVVSDEPWVRDQLDRRIDVALPIADGDPLIVPLPSPEDVVLAKLRWYDLGNRVSEVHWRDILGVLRIQADVLEWPYLQRQAAALRLERLLADARRDAGMS